MILKFKLSFHIFTSISAIYFHTAAQSGGFIDYFSVTQSVTLRTTSDVGVVLVPINEDTIDELDENFFADLSLINTDFSGRITIAPPQATVTILDNDCKYNYTQHSTYTVIFKNKTSFYR